MALPGNVTPITVTNTYINPDGTACTGRVLFTPSANLQDSGAATTIAATTVAAPLSSGAISIALPANNDTDLSPTGTTYTVIEEITGRTPVTYSISLPISAPGGTLDLASTAPTSSSVGTGTQYRLLTEAVNTVATSGSTQTLPDVTTATIHDITLSANCTFTFPTAVAGKCIQVILRQDGTGSRTATWPSGVKWPSGTAPTLTTTASKYDVFEFTATSSSAWAGRTYGLNYT